MGSSLESVLKSYRGEYCLTATCTSTENSPFFFVSNLYFNCSWMYPACV